jgi:hypothetical protein
MRRSVVVVGVVSLLALVAGACGGDDQFREGEGTKSIETARISVTASAPTSVKGNVVPIDVSAHNVKIVKADGDTGGTTGHYHVFVDREPVRPGREIPRAPGVVHSTDDPIQITGLTRGRHTFTVVLGDGAHTRLSNAKAEVTVTVEGPTVEATAPAKVAAGQPFEVTATVQGVSLVRADGDLSGKTGHLHLFIDKDPAEPGEAIPTGDPAIIHSASSPIAVPALAAGEHTLWVVLGNGGHIAWKPAVLAKLTVTVE